MPPLSLISGMGKGRCSIKGLLLGKTPQSQEDGNGRTMGNHCSSSFPELTASGNATGIQGTAALCVFLPVRVVGAVLLPWRAK